MMIMLPAYLNDDVSIYRKISKPEPVFEPQLGIK